MIGIEEFGDLEIGVIRMNIKRANIERPTSNIE